MTTTPTKKPPVLDDTDGSRNHFKTHRNSTKKPPYYNSLTLDKRNNLVVCAGSGAWARAKSATWFPGCKLVLPFGDDPAAYAWGAAAGHDVLIAGFGDLESIAIIAKLAGLLLVSGAGLVIYAPERGPMTRFVAKRTEAAECTF
jgi:hypothetical protein